MRKEIIFLSAYFLQRKTITVFFLNQTYYLTIKIVMKKKT